MPRRIQTPAASKIGYVERARRLRLQALARRPPAPTFNMQSAGAAPSQAVGVPCPTIIKSQDEVVERVRPKRE